MVPAAKKHKQYLVVQMAHMPQVFIQVSFTLPLHRPGSAQSDGACEATAHNSVLPRTHMKQHRSNQVGATDDNVHEIADNTNVCSCMLES